MLKIEMDCSACGACAQACPKNCITLKPDDRGMVYPKIIEEALCVNCTLCEKVCHLNATAPTVGENQLAYAVVSLSKEVLNRSTSGGAFTAIAKHILSQKGAVYGCAYVDRLHAQHICVEDERDLVRLNGSKYVESEIGNTYQQAKQMLDEGRMVLFSGTPCQIAGLKAFLRKPYENLVTVDIVCHGVAPQVYFQKYLDWVEKKHKFRITNYDFRSKRNSGWSIAGIAEGISSPSGKSVVKKIFYFNEYYYYHFLKGTIYRDSCYSCKYATLNRPGDFSLGDLWGAESLDLDYRVDSGCSLVLANNAKANAILDAMPVHKTKISLDFAKKYNQQLQHASNQPKDREEVLEKFVSASSKEIYQWFRKKTIAVRLKGRLKHLMPHRIKNVLLKLRYKA